MCDHRNIWFPWCDSVHRKHHNAASVTVKCDVPISSNPAVLKSLFQPRMDTDKHGLKPRTMRMDDSSYITGTELFVDGGMAQV